MEVILLEKIEKLGNVGDKVSVKGGYGRNYLIPQEKALRATKDNIAYFEAKRADIEKEDGTRKSEAEGKVARLDKLIVTLIMQAGEDGRLFGSVNARNVAKAVTDKVIEVDHKNISISEPIKYLGVHPVKIALHPEVISIIHVNVARTEAEAQEAEKAFLAPKKEEKKADAPAEVAKEEVAKAEEASEEEVTDSEIPEEKAE